MTPAIKKILYANDLSEQTRTSLSWAMTLARKHDAQLLMLNVIEDIFSSVSLQVHFSEREWKDLKQRFDNEAKGMMQKRLEAFCEEVKNETPQCTYVADEILVRRGNAVEKIIDTAEKQDCDIIVMGTHGTGGLRDSLMGSTARRVLRRSKIPVFVVPVRPAR